MSTFQRARSWVIDDDFGQEVFKQFSEHGDAVDCVVEPRQFRSRELVIAPIAWESTSLLSRLSDLAIRADATLVPIVLTPSHIRLGPVIAGGVSSCCYQCFLAIEQKRHRDNGIGRYLKVVRTWPTDKSPPLTPYLFSHVLAASASIKFMADLKLSGGEAWYLGGPDGVTCSRFEGIDGCRRCGSPRRDRTAFEGTPWD